MYMCLCMCLNIDTTCNYCLYNTTVNFEIFKQHVQYNNAVLTIAASTTKCPLKLI